MADPFELVLGGGLSDVDKQKMIAAALRNRKQVGDISMLTGDEKLGAFGKVLNDDVGKSESEALGVRNQEQSRALTKDYYDQLKEQAGLAQTMAGRRESETERHNRETERIGELNATRMRSAQNRQDSTNVRKLSEKLVSLGIPDIKNDINNLDSVISKYKPGDDLPGTGMTAWMPQALMSKDGQLISQARSAIRNKLLKLRSGAAVTNPEAARFAEELGTMLSGTDEVFLTNWPQVKKGIQSIEQAVKAGYDDDIVQTYDDRTLSRGAPPSVSQPSSQAKTVKWSDLGR